MSDHRFGNSPEAGFGPVAPGERPDPAARTRRTLIITTVAASIALIVVAAGVITVALVNGWFGPLRTEAGGGPPASVTSESALATKPVLTKGTGPLTSLAVTTLVEGTGAPVVAGQTVKVNYVGVFYATGEEFDSSWDVGHPITVTLGVGQLIKGWDQGLIGVKVGSRVQLDIPADLAYGLNPDGGYPGGPLRFVVDVLSVARA